MDTTTVEAANAFAKLWIAEAGPIRAFNHIRRCRDGHLQNLGMDQRDGRTVSAAREQAIVDTLDEHLARLRKAVAL